MKPTHITASTPVVTPASKQSAPSLGAGRTALIVVLCLAMGAGLLALCQYLLAQGPKPTTMAQIGAFAFPLMATAAFGKWLEKKLTPRR